MNGLPIIEAYSRPDAKSTVALLPVILLGFINVFFFAKGITLIVCLVFIALLLVAAVFTVVGNRRRGIPLLRIYEDRIEYRLALQRHYRVYPFSEISSATMNFVFPAFQMLRLEFSDRRKPVQIQLTNLDKPVETLYKLIVERVEL